MDSQHGQFPSRWNHQCSENIDFKGVTCKQFYFESPANIEKWIISNINNPSHGLFVDIVSFGDFFGN